MRGGIGNIMIGRQSLKKDKKFFVSLGSQNGRVDHATDRQRHTAEKYGEFVKHLLMQSRIPHDTAFTDLALADLELGFDQRQDGGVLLHKWEDSRYDNFEGNKRNVDRDEIDRLSDGFKRQVADVGPFEDSNARVLPQFPSQLAIADIDGEYFARTVLDEAIGETARGRAHIEADLAGDEDLEGL